MVAWANVVAVLICLYSGYRLFLAHEYRFMWWVIPPILANGLMIYLELRARKEKL